ncbi:MAG: transketolase family protein, partial [Oscillospiraceae bacterium]
LRIGVNDVFGYSGPAEKLLEAFGLCADNITKKTLQFLGK